VVRNSVTLCALCGGGIGSTLPEFQAETGPVSLLGALGSRTRGNGVGVQIIDR
jgi:hypothetical protein